jgi:alginate O-acetyltransferase complex protein AlgI
MHWQEILDIFSHNPEEPLLFHTGFFLFIFSVFLVFYSFVYHKERLRNLSIILFGFYFYYKASGIFVILLFCTITTDYLFSILISKNENLKYRRLFLLSGILFSLSFLFYFKYKNFFMENFYSAVKHNLSPSTLILPIGISFYTFQSISYLVDIYNKKITKPSYLDYLMYMTFFPHLVAGPIVRASDFIPRIKTKISINNIIINEAFFLIAKGFIKKAIVGDYVAQYSDVVFSAPDGFSGTEHILATLCYTLQIFCDFSGYTDMALGVSLLLGFRLCLNFNSPYKAQNITDFWRRWHISLSSWLRDYIYIPLGGNKKGMSMQLLLLFFTMLVGGFWHGADMKFIFWGAAHGILLILHKLFINLIPVKNFKRWFNYFSLMLTFCCVSLLWIPFRAQSISETLLIYSKIFTDSNVGIIFDLALVNPLLFVLILLGYSLTLFPSEWKEKMKQQYFDQKFYHKIIILIILIQIMLQLRSSSVQPFIYFQF